MAASATVSQFPQSRNLLTPRHGVITLYGYGISVNVNRGHLILKDGIGSDRHEARLPRVGHGLRRLVVVGSDGFVSLAAFRWLADQDAAFVMLERDGSVLAVTGPVHPSDARLRRAQALANTSGMALQVSKELIRQKLTAQEQLARDKLNDSRAGDLIAANQAAIEDAQTIEALRLSESRAAHAYWSAWRNVPVLFPKKDLPRVPEHWRRFGARISPLTGSPRLSVNPPNAMLNYLYALLESESRLAAAALGLDPGIGLMHVDTDARDSLACDLMEPVRPLVDAYVLDWIIREHLRREWFFEQRTGNCRLVASFAVRLSETSQTWGRAVAPVAEWVARELWSTTKKAMRMQLPATRLTQSHKREAKSISANVPACAPANPLHVCRGCGASVKRDRDYCTECGLVVSTDKILEVGDAGRLAAQSPDAQASRAETQRRNAVAQREWKKTEGQSTNPKMYEREIQPRLSKISISAIATALCVSWSYAADIRKGKRRPHARHWGKLAQLVGHSQSN
jgi:CRISPR-associated endonuclease Cas1